MLCDVMFSFFTLNTSFFDFTAERQTGKITHERCKAFGKHVGNISLW